MDRYSKFLLTVVTLLLAVIAAGLWLPIAIPSFRGGGPTYGQLMELREISDSRGRIEARKQLINAAPVVCIENGVEVIGNVEVTGEVDVGRVRGTVDVVVQ